MGEAAARLADVVIVTDDNPRSEPAAEIRAAVLGGTIGAESIDVFDIGDRRAAIEHAVASAHHGDVVLVLGKGHEQGQDVHGVVTPFDDRVVVAQVLAAAADAAHDRGSQP
jgi:UDP-N-acetylmuramoyl-L-alanyl-D-glutamate--2,6-diaminopimelate ligase